MLYRVQFRLRLGDSKNVHGGQAYAYSHAILTIIASSSYSLLLFISWHVQFSEISSLWKQLVCVIWKQDIVLYHAVISTHFNTYGVLKDEIFIDFSKQNFKFRNALEPLTLKFADRLCGAAF